MAVEISLPVSSMRWMRIVCRPGSTLGPVENAICVALRKSGASSSSVIGCSSIHHCDTVKRLSGTS